MVHPIAKFLPSVAPRIAGALLTLSIISFAVPSASAQSTPGERSSATADKGAPAANDRLIISNMPERKSSIHNVLSKMVARARKRVLGLTKCEVWSVPQSQSVRLTEKLQKLGLKVTKLRADWNHILKRHDGPVAMSRSQEEMLKASRAAPEAVGVGVMKTSEAAVTEYALMGGEDKSKPADGTPGEAAPTIVVPIKDDQSVTVRRIRATTTADGYTWRGVVEETGESAVLMWWKDGRLTGVLGYKGHIYTVVNMGGEVHAVIEVDPRKMPPDHAAVSPKSTANSSLRDDRAAVRDAIAKQQPPPAPAPPPPVKPFSDAERRALEAKKITIDVMMLYTKKPSSRYIGNPADLIALAIEQANESFRNSGVANVSLRLVHTQLVDYDETDGEHFDHLYRMVDGVGPFKEVHKLRDEKRADIVGLIVDDASGCGLSTRVAADPDEAYFVVHHSCAAITISIAHEVGHILGARHDRQSDANNSPFPFAHGYINGKKWRTMMSYQEGCDGCPRIPYWSNPRIKYKDEATGTDTEDNARAILQQAERVSKFR
jgi:hypothetical protein